MKPITLLLKSMSDVSEDDSGCLTGGFISVSDFYVIIGISETTPGTHTPSSGDKVTNRANSCWNKTDCGGSTNLISCHNGRGACLPPIDNRKACKNYLYES